jgi:hypothetical protein
MTLSSAGLDDDLHQVLAALTVPDPGDCAVRAPQQPAQISDA